MHVGRRRYFDSSRAPISLLDSKMSIFRYTCFISFSRAGNCDVQARGHGISCRTQAMGFPAGPRQWDFLQGPGNGISCRAQAIGFPAGPRQWDFLQSPGNGISCRAEATGFPAGVAIRSTTESNATSIREILTFCHQVMKSEVRSSGNIVSDMNAKC